MRKRIHIVGHFHWDSEWYFSDEESKILLMNDVNEIIDYLEEHPEYPAFTFDGQVSIIEEYLQLAVKNKERLEKLIKENRIIIGPWYTQTDEMIVAGESIVRNLLYGQLFCEKYGHRMKIGYLPDSFGQSSQLPMILNGFDIQQCIFWRGISERKGCDRSEFYWTSDDESCVLTQNLPLGYAIGKYLPEEESKLQERFNKYFSVLDYRASTENILIPQGHDQMPIQKNIQEIIERLRKIYPDRDFFLSSYERLFEELNQRKDYARIKGEFLDGKYMRVHRSIYSSRADIKIYNTKLENRLVNILEPLASIAYVLGFEYYNYFIEKIWKIMLLNHAHDSIGGCCSDKVNKFILNRYFSAEEKIDSLINYYKRKIVDGMSNEIFIDKITVFNFLPYSRKEVVKTKIITKMNDFDLIDCDRNSIPFIIVGRETIDPGIIDRQIVHYGNYDTFNGYTVEFECEVPSMGFTTIFIKEVETSDNLYLSKWQKDNFIENEFYKIIFNKNGTFELIDKLNNKTYENLMEIIDEGDDGDEYDYSPINDIEQSLINDAEAKILVDKNKFEENAKITLEFPVYRNLELRKKNIKDVKIPINIMLNLKRNSKIIDIEVEIKNCASEHRLRVLFPSGILNPKNSIADVQFGNIKRPIFDDAMKNWKKDKWSERPDSIYPMLSYVCAEGGSLAVLTNSVREYEIVGKDYEKIAVTLFRSVSYLGKEDLIRRPGRPSGIRLYTPDARLEKKMKFNLGICTYENENIAKMAKEYLTPLECYNKNPYDAMKMNSVDFSVPYSYSLFKQENENCILSACKKMEKLDDLLVRLFNVSESVQETKLNVKIKNEVTLAEKKKEINSKKIKPNQVKSFLLELEKNNKRTIINI